jgi:hypothetical protein
LNEYSDFLLCKNKPALLGFPLSLVSTDQRTTHSQSLSLREREAKSEFLLLYRAFLSLFYLCSQDPVEEKRLGDEGFLLYNSSALKLRALLCKRGIGVSLPLMHPVEETSELVGVLVRFGKYGTLCGMEYSAR